MRKFSVQFTDGTSTEGIYINSVEYSGAMGFETVDYTEIIVSYANTLTIFTEPYENDESIIREIADQVVLRENSRIQAVRHFRFAYIDKFHRSIDLKSAVDYVDDAAARNDTAWRVK